MARTSLPPSTSELLELQPNAPETRTKTSAGFVAVDVAKLSQLLMADAAKESNSVMTKNPLSRKGAEAGAGDGRDKKKTAEGDNPAAGSPERPSLSVLVASERESEGLGRAPAPDHGARWRRVGIRRAPAAWLDPGRVVVLFGALSSMGTLILLYFTLSMSRATIL